MSFMFAFCWFVALPSLALFVLAFRELSKATGDDVVKYAVASLLLYILFSASTSFIVSHWPR